MNTRPPPPAAAMMIIASNVRPKIMVGLSVTSVLVGLVVPAVSVCIFLFKLSYEPENPGIYKYPNSGWKNHLRVFRN